MDGTTMSRRTRRVLLVAMTCVVGTIGMSAGVGQAPQPMEVSRMLWIEGGRFTRGSNDADLRFAVSLCARLRGLRGRDICTDGIMTQLLAAEAPQTRVHVSRFGIDRTEVTRRDWARCVAAGRCAPSRVSDSDARLASPDMPVTGVDFHESSAYCEFAGGRLPTEAEWERAARGGDGRRFPWGLQYNDRMANHASPVDGFRYAAPVGSFPEGASPFGLLDMAGNAWEWTADRYDPIAYNVALSVDPRGPDSGGQRVIRGGSWRAPAEFLRVTMRVGRPAGHAAPDLGFRCAYDP